MSNRNYVENINIFTQFGDLSPSQILTVYQQFLNLPGFQGSQFLESMETSLIKMETNAENVIEDQAFPDDMEDETTKKVNRSGRPKKGGISLTQDEVDILS